MVAILAFGATALSGTPASAQGYAARAIGEWEVSSSSDKQGCFMTRTYQRPGGTTLMFGLDIDDSNRLTILNANWSIHEREQLKLTFRLSNASFPRHVAVGIGTSGKKGFVTSFGAAFPRNLAASRFLHVARGDVPVEELNLDGSGAAVTELRKCVSALRGGSGPLRSDDAKGRRILIDPFAVDSRRK